MQDTLLSDNQAAKFVSGVQCKYSTHHQMDHVACLQIGLDFINTVYVNHRDTKTYTSHAGRDEGVNYGNIKDLVDLGDHEDAILPVVMQAAD